MESTFRLMPLSLSSRPWLIMKARNPSMGEWCYFIDLCLPFGSSISCSHFQRFSDAIKYLAKFRTGSNNISNYLDDFLFATYLRAVCDQMINEFLKLCDQIGVPISHSKTEWTVSCIIFLGVLLDGRTMTLAIPIKKKDKAVNML